MKLTELSVRSFQALGEIQLDLAAAPLTLICGPNEQGKSSLFDAITLALTGASARVALKKDYGQLVKDGAKTGKIRFAWDTGSAQITLPGGKQVLQGQLPPPAFAALLSADTFAQLTPDERRDFLFELMGVSLSGEAIFQRLASRECDLAKVQALALDQSLPLAHKTALAKASEARGAWKALTKEAYGPQKAETWSPPEVAFDPEELSAAREFAERADTAWAEAQETLGRVKAEARTEAEHAAARARFQGHLARRPQAVTHLKALETQFAEAQAAYQLGQATAGRNGLLDEFARLTRRFLNYLGEVPPPAAQDWGDLPGKAEALVATYEAIYGPVPAETPGPGPALSELEARYHRLKRELDAARQQLAEADAAQQELALLPPPPETDAKATVAEAEAAVAACAQKRTEFREELARLEARAREAAHAQRVATEAAAAHQDNLAWEAIAAALAPDGIPGEILAESLAPLNRRLMTSAAATGWSCVTVDADMAIRLDGRPYGLGSESAQWRADALLAEAIAHLSGLKVLFLDRLDVLDLPNREACLAWLCELLEAGELDSALVGATLKQLPGPDVVPYEIIRPLWLEGGRIVQEEAAAA